jgi:hypothetical protein
VQEIVRIERRKQSRFFSRDHKKLMIQEERNAEKALVKDAS